MPDQPTPALDAVKREPPSLIDRLERIRDELVNDLESSTVPDVNDGTVLLRGSGAALEGWHLANTLRAVDEVLIANRRIQPPRLLPPLDLEAACNAVWHATQDAGAATNVGDAAVEALRAALGS